MSETNVAYYIVVDTYFTPHPSLLEGIALQSETIDFLRIIDMESGYSAARNLSEMDLLNDVRLRHGRGKTYQ